VYAGVRNPDGFGELGVDPLCLDVTDENQIADAVTAASDATIVIDNAGIQARPALLEDPWKARGARRKRLPRSTGGVCRLCPRAAFVRRFSGAQDCSGGAEEAAL
jgi:hypothetical protein